MKERAYYKMQKEHIIKRTKNKKGLVNKHLKGVGWEINYNIYLIMSQNVYFLKIKIHLSIINWFASTNSMWSFKLFPRCAYTI